LDADVTIPVLEPLRTVNERLLELLRDLDAKDWNTPSAHPHRDVKDIAAHLLHGSLRRVTARRDGYSPPTPAMETTEDLIAFIQDDNRDFMRGMRRISPQIISELMGKYDEALVSIFEGLNPSEKGLGVAWAGESVSCNWFDVAREYTEKWHHQQQIRDATGRAPLYAPDLFGPVLETFARGLPFALRDLDPREESRIVVETTGTMRLSWTLREEARGWSLWRGSDPDARTSVSIPAEVAWRVWTKSMDRGAARERVAFSGNEAVVDCIVSFVAIMA
jgi:uncharacterized protein (TIGR03083 family)